MSAKLSIRLRCHSISASLGVSESRSMSSSAMRSGIPSSSEPQDSIDAPRSRLLPCSTMPGSSPEVMSPAVCRYEASRPHRVAIDKAAGLASRPGGK